MKHHINSNSMLFLAFLTATACSIHIFESLIMRMLPIPFIRLGLSNVIVLYLILEKHPLQAITVNITKSLIGGILTFTLLTPATLLSLCGGLAAILAMWTVNSLNIGFSIFGVSICGALAHNFMQLILVHYIVLPQSSVFVLTPILLFLALFSGVLTAWILLLLKTKLRLVKMDTHESKE